MGKVWVVMGSTGEYSDHYQWPVKAFLEEQRARNFEHDCQVEASRLEKTKNGRYGSVQGSHKLDPDFASEYTGTSYFILEVELGD